MWIARNIDEIRSRRGALTGRVAFVPTMGALHAGHVSLMHAAAKLADHVVVSIFVNPTQFGPNEDFNRYPRPIEKDLDACRAAGVAGVFYPSVEAMYPPDKPACDVTVPSMASILEGVVRPGHFAGVCRVVAKLFNIVRPDVACFGQKDYQQCRVIETMTEDLAFPIAIAELATMREADGLAMSSRNVYLGPEERRHAVGLHKALMAARLLVDEEGESNPAAVEAAMRQVMLSHHIAPDYAVVRHPRTLGELDAITPAVTGGVVALVAGKLGSVRLIDNMVIGRP